MSSMFKKKGGLAFKPKVPSARPRPAVPLPSTESVSVEAEPVVEASIEAPAEESRSESQHASEPVASASSTSRDGVIQERQEPPPSREVKERPRRKEPAESTTSTPLPTIKDSLIQPELRGRDTPTQEPHELAPLVESSSSQNSQAIPAHTPDAPPAAKPRATRATTRRKTSEAAPPDAEDVRPKKRQRKATTQDADDTAAPPHPEGTTTKRRKSSTPSGPSTRSSRRARSVTPADSEVQQVDLQKLKMTDLTKDLHIGKKFSRHDELRDRERQARLKAKLKGESASRDTSHAPDPPTKSASSTPTAASASAAGPQFRIVDGQIIVDQSSLVMDRHARANAARGEMETVEENDFTRLITSNSFMNTSKLKGPNIWTPEETELFYRGLRMFGTEFEMISKMFPGKQRRHVKLKFNREERHCPERIQATLVGEKTDKIDIDEYKAFTGLEFESVEDIEAEHRKIQEGFEAEQKRIADEHEEMMRKKREELFADEEGAKVKGRKKGKQSVAYGLNGEPIVSEA